MFRVCSRLLPWWNYSTEQKNMKVLQRGGHVQRRVWPATHKIYVKKYRRGHFPNRGRTHLNVAQIGVMKTRPHRMGWPYDATSLIFNSARGADKIGYVVSTSMLKTAVVAANYMVYYPKFNQRVAKTGRYFAHDEDMACVEGDLVHIKKCRKMSKYKHYYIFSILEPNVEGRERLKLGLPVRPPALFGYPNTRRVMKINLTSKSQSKEMLAAAMQEQVSQFYKYSGSVTSSKTYRGTAEESNTTFEEAHQIVAPNAGETPIGELEGGGDSSIGTESTDVHSIPPDKHEDYTELEQDMRRRKGDIYWNRNQPFSGLTKDTTRSP